MAKTILVVDDSSTVRKLIIYSLGPNNYNYVEASDGVEALEKMSQNQVDLVIADLNMPKMDGIELIRTIRKSPSNRDAPVIMLTRQGDREPKKEKFDAGANVYLVKPAPARHLLLKVKSLLGEN